MQGSDGIDGSTVNNNQEAEHPLSQGLPKSLSLDRMPSINPMDVYCDTCSFVEDSIHAERSGIIHFEEILHEIQMRHVFFDSKEFVDMPMKHSPHDIFHSWQQLNHDELTKDELTAWIHQNFLPAGSDCIYFDTFPDYSPHPPILDKIKDEKIRDWARTLNDLWPVFGRKTAPLVAEHQDRYTLIAQPHPFLVPGGRFPKGIILNMLDMVRKFGYIPNGSRSYYLNRSQPPLLCEMVFEYYNKTKDLEFVRTQCLELLQQEYFFWMQTEQNGHAVNITHNGKHYILNRYSSLLKTPRPESYREDIQLAAELGLTPDKAHHLFADVAAAAESGWDFSARWFADKKTMKTINIRHLIPVDLNCIMYKYERNMAFLFDLCGDKSSADFFVNVSTARQVAVRDLLYDSKAKQWYDLNFHTMQHTKISAASNYFPLWAGLFDPSNIAKVIDQFRANNLLQRGGVVGTVLYTRQQWDYPNAWPPIQWFLVEGLRNCGNEQGRYLAKEIAVTWLHSCLAGFENSGGKMFEKYDVRVLGYRGFGGEYEPQDGFGWTNGVVFCFLAHYGDSLSYDSFAKAKYTDDKEYAESVAIQEFRLATNVTKGMLRNFQREFDAQMTAGLAQQQLKTPYSTPLVDIIRKQEMSKSQKAPIAAASASVLEVPNANQYHQMTELVESSLKMIPTFIRKDKFGQAAVQNQKHTVLAVEFGVALDVLMMQIEGSVVLQDTVRVSHFSIPNAKKTGDGEKLFLFAASCIQSAIKAWQLNVPQQGPENIPCGLSFSFPVKQTSLASGRLIHWAKEFSATGVIGQDVTVMLQTALDSIGLGQIKIQSLVNNGVGALCNGYSTDSSCSLGIVVGSGTNLAYWENITHINALHSEFDSDHMIINTEWGSFNSASALPRTKYDVLLDNASKNKNKQLFEKMVGGIYMAELCRLVFRDLMDRKVIRRVEKIRTRQGSLQLPHLARLVNDDTENLEDIKAMLAEEFGFDSLLQERKKYQTVGRHIIMRAGRLVGAGIAAVAVRHVDVTRGVVVACTGAVFSHIPLFRHSVEGALGQLLSISDVQIQLKDVSQAPGCGAAIAAVLHTNE